MYAEEERLRDFLLDAGLLSRSQLDAALQLVETSGTPLSRVLIESGALGEDEVRRAMARGLGVPFVRFTPNEIDHDALAMVPEPLARRHSVVATALQGDVLQVALLDIADLPALEQLQLNTKYKIVPRLTDRESMTRALLHYQRHLKEQFGARIARDAAAVAADMGATPGVLAERLHTRAAVDALIGHALYQGASAVHLEPREQGLLLRYRIGTVLYDAMQLPGAAFAGISARLKQLAQVSLGTTLPQEGRFRVAVGESQVSVRVSTAPIMVGGTQGEKVVLQLMHEQAGRKGFTLESLGLHMQARDELHHALSLGSGLIVVAGPQQSGKTTLLYTLLDMLGGRGMSIAAVEDPVEMYLPFVTQTAVAPETGLTFGVALRAALRQDPDVVMVSDLRDADTALLAAEAANRGVLVLAAIEASSAAAGLERLLELGVPPLLLASALRCAVGTAVVRKLCPNHEQHRLGRAQMDAISTHADLAQVLAILKSENKIDSQAQWKDVAFFQAGSCNLCRGGYSGTLGLQEVWPISAVLKEIILREGDAALLQEAAKESGLCTLVGDGVVKAAQGLTSIDEVLKVAGQD